MMPYQHIRTYGASDRAWLSALSDLSIIPVDGHRYLFTVTQKRGGGVTAYELDELTGLLNRVDTQAFPIGATYGGEPEIAFFRNETRKYIYLTNLGTSEYLAINLSDNGKLNGYDAIASPNQFRHVTAFGEFETSTGKFLYSAFQDDLSIHITKVQENGGLTNLSSVKIPLPYPHENASIERILVAHSGDKQYIVAVSGLGNFIAAYEITDTGALVTGSLHTSNMGIGYLIPTDAIEVKVAGQSYIVVASPGSATLTVLQLDNDGKLKAADHILDERTTRFDNITAIDSVTLDGRSFIFVGGVDDGISVFTLQPGGTLLHLQSIEDQNTITLQDVTDIETAVHNGKIEVFISSAKEPGITHLRFDPGKIGKTEFTSGGFSQATLNNDLLIAEPKAVRLFGREGDDILVSGDRGITFDGGPGADIFVPTAIKGTITIRNYEPGIDQLDFSQLGIARSIYDLRMNVVESTATIRRLDLKIVIHTKDQVPFPLNELTNKIFPIAHYDTPEQEPVFLPRPTQEELLLPYLLGKFPEKEKIEDPLIDPHPPGPDPIFDRPVEPDIRSPSPTNGSGDCYEISELVGQKIQALFAKDQTKSSNSVSTITSNRDDHDFTARTTEDAFIFDTTIHNLPDLSNEEDAHVFTETNELYIQPDLNDQTKANLEIATLYSAMDFEGEFLL